MKAPTLETKTCSEVLNEARGGAYLIKREATNLRQPLARGDSVTSEAIVRLFDTLASNRQYIATAAADMRMAAYVAVELPLKGNDDPNTAWATLLDEIDATAQQLVTDPALAKDADGYLPGVKMAADAKTRATKTYASADLEALSAQLDALLDSIQ